MRRKQIPILLTLLVAFALRTWGLADHNIWWDEGLAAWAARLPVAGILDWTAHDVHPPLYFLVLRGWWLIVGDGEFVLRFPSAMMGTLGASLIYRLGRALGGRRAGLLAALLLALSRFAITWSQEMRMYIWAATLATGALWATVRLWRSRGQDLRAWVAYVLTIAGGLWSLFLMISVPITTNLAFLPVWLRQGRPRHLLNRWITAQLAAAALFTPWLVYALPRMPTWSTSEPFSPTFFLRLYATMLTVGIPVDLQIYAPLAAAAFGVLLAGLIAVGRSSRTPTQTGGLTALALGLTLPALVVYVVSLPIHLYYAPRLAPRYLLPLSVCFYTLLGWGLATLAQKHLWGATLGSGLVVAVALTGLVPLYPGRARRDDYVSIAATLRAHRRPGDAVLLHTDKEWPIFAAHYAGDWRGVPYGRSVSELTIADLVAPVWEQAEGIWLVLTPDVQRTDPKGLVETWLAEQAVATESWHFGEGILRFYARTNERAARIHHLAPGFTPPVASDGAPGAEIPLPRYRTGDTVHMFLYWESPPSETVTVQLRQGGKPQQEVVVDPPAPDGLLRQPIDLPLTADLPGGHYRVVIQIGAGPTVDISHFTLLAQHTAASSLGETDIPHPLDLHLGKKIRLVGYNLSSSKVAPGDMLELTLYWQAIDPIETRYKVFTHLLGQSHNPATGNRIWGQRDSEPVNGQAPTTTWVPNVIIADTYVIPVAPDAPPGQYELEVGMYGLIDGDRLPVVKEGETVGDRVLLELVEVTDG